MKRTVTKTTVIKRLTAQTRFVSLLGLFVFLWTAAYAQITPLGDSYINTAAPTTNYGTATLLDVNGAKQTTYIQFNLASIPATASVSQATLKLYVNAVTTAGSFNVDYVNGAWSEGTIDSSNAPPLGAAIASNVSVTTADKNQYILVNVTSAVQAWLNGSEANSGVALVANSTFNATFDSKESTTTSHPAELDIAFAGGSGTITGVTTASGSGLTGGGTSGTLNLSLTNGCAASQVLQWNGSAWACASAGTGTITGVTAGTDLTGGGTSGNVTLNLNTTALNETYALVGAENTFAYPQVINGGLTANSSSSGGTGVYANAGSSGGSNGVIAYGATGVAGYTTVNGSIALFGNAGSSTGSNGVVGYGATGVAGNSTITGSYGTYGSGSTGVWGSANGTGADVGVFGTTGLGIAVEGTAVLGVGGYFVNDSDSGDPALVAYNDAPANDASVFAMSVGGVAGYCEIDGHGNLGCSGSKSAVVPVDGGSREVALYAVEAPENWFEDYGSGQLSSGSARIDLEPTFTQTVNTDLDYHVFLTPRGECEGLYVADLTPSGFEVRELHHGSSSVAFDYRIIAKRRNYEAVRLADLTEGHKKMEEQMARARKRKPATIPVASKLAPAPESPH
ncbi:MAG: DNRLRE domain-containing protein [Terriglobales bacterium]